MPRPIAPARSVAPEGVERDRQAPPRIVQKRAKASLLMQAGFGRERRIERGESVTQAPPFIRDRGARPFARDVPGIGEERAGSACSLAGYRLAA